MKQPILFLISAGSRPDRPEGWYCPDCALVEGVLGYYPQLRAAIDVRHVAFPRPRSAIIALVGEGFQDSPCLLLDPAIGPAEAPVANGWRVITENTKLLLDTLALLAPGVGRSGTGSLF
ncbi:MAG: DUF3088 domain-containing protein [Beijerinckiaceae bacterium]|nr:DUF3088 domain-containing protein [Beijerinckiaceae bacterium]